MIHDAHRKTGIMSDATETCPPPARLSRPESNGYQRFCVVLLLAVYAAGLTHGMSRPWTGMHDWNGAFFSQLARNLLRYPIEVHHGMGLVAVGEAVPPPEERSIYATHPPGLIWLIAAAFRLLGEAEWAARLVAVLPSLATLVLLVRILDRAWGRQTALLAGLIYSVLPMTVYFGRMVDHEAVCLFFMMAATCAWQELTAGDSSPGPRRMIARLAWIVAILGAILVDWPGLIFAALFCIYVLIQWIRRRVDAASALMVVIVAALGAAATLAYLVYAGLDGRWGDLVAIFVSRATEAEGEMVRKDLSAPGGPWQYTVENLTWPMMLLAMIGAVMCLLAGRASRAGLEAQDSGRPIAGRAGVLWILPATGVIWLCLFWRQYERHNYWLFYLGPAAAMFAAQALLSLRERFTAYGRQPADGVMFAVMGAILAFAFHGTEDYFARISSPPDAVLAWAQINRATRPDDRMLLYSSPVLEEWRGDYRFRNLVPPQMAYYLDRAFDVEQDPNAVPQKAPLHAAYLVPLKKAAEQESSWVDLRHRYASALVGPYVVFDLRSKPQ